MAVSFTSSPFPLHDTGRQIHFQVTGAKDGGFRRGRRMPLSNPQARQQFAGAEGLGHIIIRPVVERRDLVLLAVAHREHDHRHMAPLAQALEHGDALHVRQPEVEQHHVGRALRGLGDAFLAGGGFRDAVAVRLQAHAQQPAHLQFVVDD